MKEQPGQEQASSVNTEVIEEKNPQVGGKKKQVRQPSEARLCAQWLLRKKLDAVLCEGLDREFENRLTSIIAGSGLLRHGWTWKDLRDEIHGFPENKHLPRWIRDPCGWIIAAFARADPERPPSLRWRERELKKIESGSRWFAENAARPLEAERAARRDAIDKCELCDHSGLLDLGDDVPVTRCNHDPHSGGW